MAPFLVEFAFVFLHFSCRLTTTQTIADYKYPDDFSELMSNAKNNDNTAIYGNPLLYPECANALMHEHKYNEKLLRLRGFPTPWFWSRESLDATISEQALHRRLKVTHAFEPNSDQKLLPFDSVISNAYSQKFKRLPAHIVRWYNRLGNKTNEKFQSNKEKLSKMNDLKLRQNQSKNVYYYHIEKAGSSSIGSGILNQFNFSNSYFSENLISSTQCGFTFVRNPIYRFISAYYTVNRLIYFHNLPGAFKSKYQHFALFKWYNISGEPLRFQQFVDDLTDSNYHFVRTSPLEHMMSQTGILSIVQSDIHFVGRLEQLKTHWNQLFEFCDMKDVLMEYPTKEFSRMKGYGLKGIKEKENEKYAELMGLLHYEDGDILPAFKAIADSYDIYAKIVKYYRQDFVCFGYEADYKGFRDEVNEKWNKMVKSKKERGVPMLAPWKGK